MKIENYKQVQQLMTELEIVEKKLTDLNSDNLSVKIHEHQYTVMTIGAWKSCEHDAKHIAMDFVKRLQEHYYKTAVYLKDKIAYL